MSDVPLDSKKFQPPYVPTGPMETHKILLNSYWKNFKQYDLKASPILKVQSERVHDLLDRSFWGLAIGFMKQVDECKSQAFRLQHRITTEDLFTSEMNRLHDDLKFHVRATYKALALRIIPLEGEEDIAYRLLGFTIRAARAAIASFEPGYAGHTHVLLSQQEVIKALDTVHNEQRIYISAHDNKFIKRLELAKENTHLNDKHR